LQASGSVCNCAIFIFLYCVHIIICCVYPLVTQLWQKCCHIRRHFCIALPFLCLDYCRYYCCALLWFGFLLLRYCCLLLQIAVHSCDLSSFFRVMPCFIFVHSCNFKIVIVVCCSVISFVFWVIFIIYNIALFACEYDAFIFYMTVLVDLMVSFGIGRGSSCFLQIFFWRV